MRKIDNQVVEEFLSYLYPKRNGFLSEIKEAGKTDDEVLYITYQQGKIYCVAPLGELWQSNISLHDFKYDYLPKFGKCEIEDVIAKKLLISIIVEKNVTDLLNTEFLFFGSYNTTHTTKEIVTKRILPLFDVIEEKGNAVLLKFKWEKLSPNY